MAYSDFSLLKLERDLGVGYQRKALFQKPFRRITPSLHLEADIHDGLELPVFSEKAKSELLITPILRRINQQHSYLKLC